MYKTKGFINAIWTLALYLCFININYDVHAAEVKTWVRGPTVVEVGHADDIRLPGICGGDGEYHTWELTEEKYTSKHLRYYEICSGYYNMDSTIEFDSPEVRIGAGETVQLKAKGVKTGKQNCCFIYDWFYYAGTCGSLGSDEDVFLDLRALDLTEFVIPESGKETTGYDGTVTHEIDVNLTMPESGTECTVTGYSSGGLWLSWTYQLVTEYLSYVDILYIDGNEKVVCSDSKEREYTVALINNGSTVDTGTINLSIEGQGPVLSDNTIPYSLSAGEKKVYPFNISFPETMYSNLVFVHANISSNVGKNDERKYMLINVACRLSSEGANAVLFFYLMNAGGRQ